MATMLTLPQVAEELGLTRYRVWQLVREGMLPAERCPCGQGWLVKRGDLRRVRNRPGPGWPKGRPRKG